MSPKRIGFIGFDGIVAIDLAGPAEAFATAQIREGRDEPRPCYEVLTIGGILLGLLLICVVGIAIIVSALRGNQPSIRDNSVLALKISGALPDYVPDDPFRRLFGGQPQSLSSLMTQFRKAKADKRISAVLLDIDMPEMTGPEVCRIVRENPPCPHLKVIIDDHQPLASLL